MSLRLVRNVWRFVIVGLAAGHIAVACLQQSMNADGLNYLTLGTAFWRGDWDVAINGIWSPLYGVIAAGVLRLVQPPIPWVFPTVQIVNFAIFVASLVCFERLWRELWLARSGQTHVPRAPTVEEAEPSDPGLPAWLWWSMGYALFLWAGLNLVEIWSVTPDMLVSAVVYLAAALMVRIGSGKGTWVTRVALGVTLGVGYLAKAPLFPLGVVALALTALTADGVRAAIRRTAPAVAAFLVVAGPLLTAISIGEGRLAFSAVSRFTYLKHVNRIPFPHWREGAVEGVGSPRNPPRRVHTDPDAFVYEGPVGGPYPPSLDPDYWTEGLTPRVDVGQQLNEVANSLAFYFTLFFRAQGPLLGIMVLASGIALASAGRPPLRSGAWYLTGWAVACFGMYSLVFVTERYIAAWVLLFWAGLFSYWREGLSGMPHTLARIAGAAVVVFTMVNVLALNVEGAAALAGVRPPVETEARGQFAGAGQASGRPPAIAAGLLDAGMTTGEDIAYIGYSYTALWAYLVDARIVGEIWPEQAPAFWDASPDVRDEVLARFREAGASWVVAGALPPNPPIDPGWRIVGSTGYWIMPLRGDEAMR